MATRVKTGRLPASAESNVIHGHMHEAFRELVALHVPAAQSWRKDVRREE